MKGHYYKWDTSADDELGLCPEPGCKPGTVGVVHFNGHMIVTARTCRYCWARFAPARPTDAHCSKTCKARDVAHNAWIRETQREAAYGRRGPKAPRGGASLEESVARFSSERELVAS